MRISDYPEMVERVINVLPSVREDKNIHVTDLIFCLRKAWYRLRGYPAVVSSSSRVITSIGHAIHEYIQNKLNVEAEKKVELDGIVGSIDGIMGDTILEIKTTRHFYGIKDFWKKQILAYMKMYGVNKAILLVIDTNIGSIIAYKIEATDCDIENNWRYLLNRKRILEESLKSGNPPGGPEYVWECDRCPFRNVCMGSRGLLDILSTKGDIYEDSDV